MISIMSARLKCFLFSIFISCFFCVNANSQSLPNVTDSHLKSAIAEVVKGNGASVTDELSKFMLQTEKNPANYVDIDYISAFSALCAVYQNQERLQQVDSLIRHVVTFILNNNIQSDYCVRYLSQANGLLQLSLHNYQAAVQNFSIAKQDYETKAVFDLEYAKCINNLAVAHAALKDTLLAKLEMDYSLDIYQLAYPDIMTVEKPDIMNLINNSAMMYAQLGLYSKAIPYFNRVIEVGKDKPEYRKEYCLAVNNLAAVLYNLGRDEEALTILNKLDVNLLDNRVKEYYLSNKYLLTIALDQKDAAQRASLEYLDFAKDAVFDAFSSFSTFERESFWQQYASVMMYVANGMASKYEDSQSIQNAYDVALFTKNLSLYSERLIKEETDRTKNEKAKALFRQMLDLRQFLTYQSGSLQIDTISAYHWKLHEIEKDLISSLPHFKEHLYQGFKNWKEVRSMLGKGEAALEFVLLFDYKRQEIADVSYGALVLTSSMDCPKLVKLDSINAIDTALSFSDMDEINNLYSYNPSDSSVYTLVWKKIEPYLNGCNTVYLSKIGSLNKLNFSAVPLSNTKNLGDIYDIYQLTSTALISQVKNNRYSEGSDYVLYGGIKYDLDEKTILSEASKYTKHSQSSFLALRGEVEENRGSFSYLPGTEFEVLNIESIIKETELPVIKFIGEHANEESIKDFDGKSPRNLHIATHAFYLSDDKKINENKYIERFMSTSRKEQTMLYTGLLFSGANNAWVGGNVIEGAEDGILTADEISRLDMSNTKLLVLSACETGRGIIDMVDGVFGLQRGFKKAGVGTIVMSLWKVPDRATQILMTTFYKSLLAGIAPRQALKVAKDKVKEFYPEPYYWASFVVLD